MESLLKSILVAAILLSTAAAGGANPPPRKCLLRVHATGFRNQKGLAGGQVFTSPDGWPEKNDKAFASDEVPIAGTQATLSFHLPPGVYGVVVLHDENEDQKLDRNFLGVPTEGFGFANNPPVSLTAPPFHAATVNVTCPVTDINVKLIYK